MRESLHPNEEPRVRVAKLLWRQERECELLGSPLCAYLLRRSAEDVESGGLVWRALQDSCRERIIGALERAGERAAGPRAARMAAHGGRLKKRSG